MEVRRFMILVSTWILTIAYITLSDCFRSVANLRTGTGRGKVWETSVTLLTQSAETISSLRRARQ